MSENVLSVTDASFDGEVLQSESPVLVDFWAPWCGPCRMLGPIFAEVANDYIGKIKMIKANVDENPDAAQKYAVRGVPTLILFKNGEIVTTKVGASTNAQLKAFINENV